MTNELTILPSRIQFTHAAIHRSLLLLLFCLISLSCVAMFYYMLSMWRGFVPIYNPQSSFHTCCMSVLRCIKVASHRMLSCTRQCFMYNICGFYLVSVKYCWISWKGSMNYFASIWCLHESLITGMFHHATSIHHTYITFFVACYWTALRVL